MIHKVRTGIISGFSLIIVNFLIGISLIPGLKLSNLTIQLVILQIAFFYFTLSMWLSLRDVLINQYKLVDLKNTLDWVIRILGLLILLWVLSTLVSSKELNYVNIAVSIIFIINYLILFKKIYELDKHDLKYIGDLHSYLLAIVLTILIVGALATINDLVWHKSIKYIDYFIQGMPIIFLIIFFKHVKQDIQENENASA
jgi:hypothetical protein